VAAVHARRHWRSLLALSAAGGLLAGCSSSNGVAKGPPPSPITSLASYRALSLPPDAARLAVATHDAHALLDAARVPTGAVPTKVSIVPAQIPGDPNLVSVHRAYAVATLPAFPAVAFLPKGATVAGLGSSNTGMSEVNFSLPRSKLLSSRILLYTMQATAHGYTVRIDAQVTWLPAKPLAAYVAPGASRVTVAFTSPLNHVGPYRLHPVIGTTVTSGSAIQGITRAVNALPAAFLGVRFCANDDGTTLDLGFWHAGASHSFALVVIDRSGCGQATISHFDAKGSLTATGYASSWGIDKVVDRLAGMGRAPPA
jgi:hypothetical protein